MKRYKRAISTLVVCCMLISMFPVSAIEIQQDGGMISAAEEESLDHSTASDMLAAMASDTCGENLTWTLSTDGTLTITGTGEMFDYTINTVPWYSRRSSILKVVIDSGITSIGDYAFARCSRLKSVIIGDDVTSIGQSVFLYCESLTSVVMGDSMASIGESQFSTCKNLESITVSSGNSTYSSLDGVLFSKDQTELLVYPIHKGTTYTIPDGVTSIGYGAFINSTELESVVIPDSVTKIGSVAFQKCTNLKSITIPSSVKDIGIYAFRECDNLRQITVDPNNQYYSSQNGVLFNKKMTLLIQYPLGSTRSSYTVPNGVTKIYSNSFYVCRNLFHVTIPNSVQIIDGVAFCDCTNLRSITIGSGVTSIADSAFSSCDALTDIYYSGTQTQWNKITIGTNNEPLASGKIHYNSTGPELTAFPVENGSLYFDKETGTLMFCDASVVRVVIPAEIDGIPVTAINAQAFTGSGTLGIAIPDSVAAIADDAFSGRTGEVTLYGAANSASQIWAASAGIEFIPCAVSNVTPESHSTIGGDTLDMTVTTSLPAEAPIVLTFVSEEGKRITPSCSTSFSMSSGQGLYSIHADLSELSSGVYEAYLENADYGISYQFTYDVDRTPPEAPNGLTVTPGALKNLISWQCANEANTIAYRLYRSTDKNSTFELLAEIEGRNTLSYTDKSVTQGVEYYYRISSVDCFGQEGTLSSIVGGTPVTDAEPPRITSVTPENGSTVFGKTNWIVTATDNIGITSIAMEISSDGESWQLFEEVATSKEAEFLMDTTQWTQERLFVRLYAEDTSGNIGYGSTNYIYTIDNQGPSKVTGLWSESSSTVITLHWDKVPETDFSHFLVELQQSDGTFTQLAEIDDMLGINVRGLHPETQYTFRVCACDAYGNQGEWSELITATTSKDTTAPVIAGISPDSGSYNQPIPLKFTVSDDYGVDHVVVQVSQDGAEWTDLTTISVQKEGISVPVSFSCDTSEWEEGVYYIRALATDLAGNMSDNSDQAPFHQYRVDRTAPEAPKNLSAQGNEGGVILVWALGEEADLDSYRVYRAEQLEGPYTTLTSGVKKGYWQDTSAAYGKNYYYYIVVSDQAGNISEASSTVSCTPKVDETAPQVISISPSDGYTMGAAHSIRVKASDNRSVAAVKYRFSTDGSEWTDVTSVSASAVECVVTLPLSPAELEGASQLYLEVWCEDIAGNQSGIVSRSYVLDLSAPEAPELDTQVNRDGITLTWKGSQEPDLAGYKVYRAAGTNGSYKFLTQYSGGRDSYSYTDTSVRRGTVYSYYVAVLDENGNRAESERTDKLSPLDLDTIAPVAKIEADRMGVTGQETAFSAEKSTDDTQIVSYCWDFGDGNTSNLITPVHAYADAGTYTVTLTVEDAAGNQGTASQTIRIKDWEAVGTLRVYVTDENGSPVPGAGVYLDLGGENQRVEYTNRSGIVEIAAPAGTQDIGAYLQGYLPAKSTVDIITGTETEVHLTIVHQELVVGDLTVRELTLDEIRAAGIDVADPANQQVFQFKVKLIYGAYVEELEVHYNSIGTVLSDPQKITIKDPTTGMVRDVVVNYVPVIPPEMGQQKEVPPLVVMIELPGQASWLKEFFEVRLTVLNQAAQEFVLDDCKAVLNVPQGLTLMDTTYTSASPSYEMGNLAGQQSLSAYWVLRGDEAGEYDLSADFSAVLRDFGERVNARFESAEPLVVRENAGLALDIVVENAILPHSDGALRLGLRNDGEQPYYLPHIELDEDLVELTDSFKTVGLATTETDMEQLNSGETIWWEYIVPRKNWKKLTEFDGEEFVLMDAILEATGGTTTLPYTIEEVLPFTFAADLITISRVSDNGAETPIEFIGLDKDDLVSAHIPDLLIRTYRLNENHEYEPCSMEILIEDEYQMEQEERTEGITVTTNEDGTYLLNGYQLTQWNNDASYTITVSSRRALPAELVIAVYGDTAPTGRLRIYAYERINGEVKPITDASVTITSTEITGKTGEKGGVEFSAVPKGDQEIVISKEGYVPYTRTIEVANDTERSYELLPDPNPNLSRITSIETNLSGQSSGNQYVVPVGRVTGKIYFYLSHRIVPGESFRGYAYRLIHNDGEIEEGEFASSRSFYVEAETLKAGDQVQFALITEKDGNLITSDYVDSNLFVVEAPNWFNEIVFSTTQLQSKAKIDATKYFTLDPYSVIQSFTAEEFMRNVTITGENQEQQSVLVDVIGRYEMTERKESFLFPINAAYDMSGKFTLSILYGKSISNKREQDNYTTSYRSGTLAPKKDPTNLVEFHDTHDTSTQSYSTSGSIGIDFVFQYNPVRDDWSLSVYGRQRGSATLPLLQRTFWKIGYVDVTLTLTEEGKWELFQTDTGLNNSETQILDEGLIPQELYGKGEFKGVIGAQLINKKIASIGAYAKAGAKVNFAPILKGTVNASVGCEYTVLLYYDYKEWAGEEWEFIPGGGNIEPISLLSFYSEPENTLTMVCEREDAQWLGTEKGELKIGTFADARPQMVTLPDDTALMVWGDYSGDTLNPVRLYWSQFDGNEWTQPAPVSEDGTADLYPYLVPTEDGAALVWLDFTQELSEDMSELTVEEIEDRVLALTGVSLSYFSCDEASWSAPVPLTQNNSSLIAEPCGAIDADGRSLIAWIENADGLTEGTAEKKDIIRWLITDGEQIEQQGIIPAPVSSISSLDVSYDSDTFYMAFLAENESGVQKAYIAQLSVNEWTVPKEVNPFAEPDSAPCLSGDFLYFTNSTRLYGFGNGKLSHLYRSTLLGEDVSELRCTQLSSGTALLWTSTSPGQSTAYMCVVDGDRIISQPVMLHTDPDGALSNLVAASISGSLVSVCQRNTLLEDGPRTDFLVNVIPEGIDLSVESAGVSHSGYLLGGKTITTYIQASNYGAVNHVGFKAIIARDEAGEDILAEQISEQSLTMSLSWEVPSDYSGEPLYLVVMPLTGMDVDESNNVVRLDNEICDLSISEVSYIGCMDGKDVFSVNIHNQGVILVSTAELTVELRQGGDVLDTIDVPMLAPQDNCVLRVNLDRPVDNAARALSFRVDAEQDLDISNNQESYILMQPLTRHNVSGTVYDAETGDKLEGVTTTLYWIPDDTSDKSTLNVGPSSEEYGTMWVDAEHFQENPLITDENGHFECEIPSGWWRIQYTNEGYATVWSDWMEVSSVHGDITADMPREYAITLSTAADGSCNVSLSNNTSSDISVQFIVAVFDSVGQLLSTNVLTADLTAHDSVEQTVNYSLIDTAAEIRAFVLDQQTLEPMRHAWSYKVS